MEHQLWPQLLEHRTDAGLVADVGDPRVPGHLRVGLRQLSVDLPQRVFAVIQQGQAGRAKCCHLARKLRADRAACTGHQHPPSRHQPRHALTVQRHLRPVQQVFDGHGRELHVRRRRGGLQQGGGRHAPHLRTLRLRIRQQVGEPSPG